MYNESNVIHKEIDYGVLENNVDDRNDSSFELKTVDNAQLTKKENIDENNETDYLLILMILKTSFMKTTKS